MDKISIIIPVYNVEDFLEECLKSVINQKYQNLEIILIDDGSTDNSGKICDEYAKKDKRIKVIHKSNSGIADTRNVGLKNSTGKYIAFVDSDDYIEENLYKEVIEDMKKENAQIYIYGRYILYKGQKKPQSKKNIKITMDNIQAIDKMSVFGYYDSALWDKIYERKLFDNIEFPSGKVCEDWYVMHLVLNKARKIIYNSKPLYIYRQRDKSITHSDKLTINYNPIYASENVFNFVKQNYPQIILNAKTRYIYAMIGVYNNLLLYKDNSEEERVELLKKIRLNYKEIIKNSEIPINRKIQLILLNKYTMVYNTIFKILNKIRERKLFRRKDE